MAAAGQLPDRGLVARSVVAAYDDMADMMSQAASWLLRARVPTLTISNAFTGEILAQY
jgi:hypothetical protein